MRAKSWSSLVLTIMVALVGGVSCTGGDLGTSEVDQEIVLPAPTNLTLNVVSTTQINASWDVVAGAVKYIVYVRTPPGTYKQYGIVTTNSISARPLTPNTQYCFVVAAMDATNTLGSPTAEVCASSRALPPAPTNVTATSLSTSTVSVDWTAVTGASSYFVYESANGGAYTFVASTTATTYSVRNLSAATSYCFVVADQTPDGFSGGSSPPACTSTFSGGLEAYWKLNETSGTTAIDASGNGHTGTLQGSATHTTDTAPPENNKGALAFGGGTGDAVTVPSSAPLNLTGDFTVATWVKLTGTPSGDMAFLGKRPAGCGAAVTWELGQDANGVYLQGDTTKVAFGSSLTVGTWTHVAATKSGSNVFLYLNGALVSTTTVNVGALNADPFEIGNSGDCGSTASFNLDDVRIYSAALTGSQISDLGTVPPGPTNPVVTANNDSSITLSWTGVTTNNLEAYYVYIGTSSGGEAFFATLPPTTTTYTFGNLMPGTQYYFLVRDSAHGLLSPFTPEASTATHPQPAAPSGVTATPINSGQINLAWNAVPATTTYTIYISTSGGPYKFLGNSTATAFAARNLTTKTSYSFVITATTPDGVSAGSTPVSATTP